MCERGRNSEGALSKGDAGRRVVSTSTWRAALSIVAWSLVIRVNKDRSLDLVLIREGTNVRWQSGYSDGSGD